MGALRLAEILDCVGFSDTPPSSQHSLLRVSLHNVKTGLERGHVDPVAAKMLLEALVTRVRVERGATGSAPHLDVVHGLLVAVLTEAGPALFFSRTASIDSYSDARAVTLQPSWAFKYWLDPTNVPEVNNDPHSMADVVQLVRIFQRGDHRQPAARIGVRDNVLWLTPHVGPVLQIIAEAQAAELSDGPAVLDTLDHAQRLRDLLGLQRRQHPDRAIAFTSASNIRGLNAVAEDALNRGVAARRPLAAPTLFDAGDYPRFRHWPTTDGASDSDFGRTWDLAEGRVEGGAPEMVVRPMACDEFEEAVSLGPIHSVTPSPETAKARDQVFANDVCGSETVKSLLNGLSGRLGL